MQLHTLKAKSMRRHSIVVGRGGKRGKTSGRGGKGQTARAGHKIRPEARDMIKKIPKRRGHGKNRAKGLGPSNYAAPVNLAALEAAFAAGSAVTPAALAKLGIVRKVGGRIPAVKVLGAGELSKALSFSGMSFSASARSAVEKAGGSIA